MTYIPGWQNCTVEENLIKFRLIKLNRSGYGESFWIQVLGVPKILH